MENEVVSIVRAAQDRAWYPLAGVLVTLLLRLWARMSPGLAERIPRRCQWVPPVATAGLAAFVEQQATGARWYVALALAAYAAFGAGGVAIGAHHAAKRIGGS